MKEHAIKWDAVPDVITKDQLYRICHISKSTALYLLQSGKIPCEYTGRKTRCYKIKKEDVIAYLENRKVFPDYPDVLTTQEVSKITGYGKTAINNWCNQGHIRTPQGFSIWRKIRDLHTAEIEGGAEKKY